MHMKILLSCTLYYIIVETTEGKDTAMNEAFIQKLNASRISWSKSSERYQPEPCARPPISGMPFYYAEAYEDFPITHPYYMERASLDAYLLLFARSGQARLFYRQKDYVLTQDCAVFLDMNNHCRLEIDGAFSYQAVYINGPNVFAYYQRFCHDEQFMISLPPVSECSELLSHIGKLNSSNAPTADLLTSQKITDLMTLLVLHRMTQHYTQNSIPRYVSDIKKLFDNDFSSPHTLDSLAKTCRISKYQLSHEFKNHIGVPPINYLIERRMQEARRLLEETDEPVSVIASMTGIENATHFINLFKKNTGMTPLQYRKTIPADHNLY